MGYKEGFGGAASTILNQNAEKEQRLHSFVEPDSADAALIATAILLSVLLVIAFYERFLRPASFPILPRSLPRMETQIFCHSKFRYFQSPPISYERVVFVLMPGEKIPTFVAQHAPAPCPSDSILKPLHPNKVCLPPLGRQNLMH